MDSLYVEVRETVGEVPSDQSEKSAEMLAYQRAWTHFQNMAEARKTMRNRLGWMRSTNDYLIKRRGELQAAVKRLRGNALAKANQELKELDEHLRRARTLDARRLRDPHTEQAYCLARHYMMKALAELDEGDISALRQKVRYMTAANLSSSMDADGVLYYCENEKVHLFYGGRLAPPGDGLSPDGKGHAHVVLVKDGRGGFYVEYHRKPEGR